MEELITSVATKFGVDQNTAQTAVGSLFNLFRQKGDPGAVSTMFQKIPGSQQLADQAAARTENKGLLDKLSGFVAGGGDLGELGKSLGFTGDKIKGFVTTVLDFIKSKAGPDVVNKLIGSVPLLKSLAPAM